MNKIGRTVAIVGVIVALFAVIILNSSTKQSAADQVWDRAATMGDAEAKNLYVMYTDIMCPYCVAFSQVVMENEVCFPARSSAYIFYTNQGLGTTCLSPVTRNRFLLINLVPSAVLGILPLIAFMGCSKEYAAANSILFAIAFLHIGGGYADYTNVFHTIKIPKDATIQISGEKIFWWV